jgi:hypothetical protein
MRQNTKYTGDLKEEVVKAYLAGNQGGSRMIAK